MGNLTEIKEQLDGYYQEYKNKKNTLNETKTKDVAKLIVDISGAKDGRPRDVAVELARFSADVTNVFFELISKNKLLTLDVIDELIKELLKTDTDAKSSQYYVSKYAYAINSIMKYYKSEALQLTFLPELVVFMARFTIKSDKYKNKFYNLINSTNGCIFNIDYSSFDRTSLLNIWTTINTIYPDITKSTYSSQIIEWAKKYGFIKDENNKNFAENDKKIMIEEVIVSSGSELSSKHQSQICNNDFSSDHEKIVSDSELKYDNNSKIKTESASELSAKNLYISLRKDMLKGQDTIITAFTDMIEPIGKAFESIQGEIKKSREFGIENSRLKAQIEEMERQMSEQRTKLQEANSLLMSMRIQSEDLQNQIEVLEEKNHELDQKLNEAYSINSRESSLEAEKIKSELKQSFAFLYEDWLEYEFSDVSEENYESLQAIIKKIFRSLERSGIDFKGSN